MIKTFLEFEAELNESYYGNTYPEAKDKMRISDIVKKSNGDPEKQLSLARTQAKLIQDGSKALRRARAAFNQIKHLSDPKDQETMRMIAIPFLNKAVLLGMTDELEPDEKQLLRGAVAINDLGLL